MTVSFIFILLSFTVLHYYTHTSFQHAKCTIKSQYVYIIIYITRNLLKKRFKKETSDSEYCPIIIRLTSILKLHQSRDIQKLLREYYTRVLTITNSHTSLLKHARHSFNWQFVFTLGFPPTRDAQLNQITIFSHTHPNNTAHAWSVVSTMGR